MDNNTYRGTREGRWKAGVELITVGGACGVKVVALESQGESAGERCIDPSAQGIGEVVVALGRREAERVVAIKMPDSDQSFNEEVLAVYGAAVL